MEIHNYTLEWRLAEKVALPLSEIRRQIKQGLCRINGTVCVCPWCILISGQKIELGQTVCVYV